MERTTQKQLANLLRQLAAVTNSPMGEPYTRDAEGKLHSVDGVLVLDSYMPDRTRLYRVERMMGSGGQDSPFGHRRFTAGELYHALRMAIDAVRLAVGEDEFHKRMRRAYPDKKAA